MTPLILRQGPATAGRQDEREGAADHAYRQAGFSRRGC